jgi:hypothetical protein
MKVFGKGFYLTSLKEQAETIAIRKGPDFIPVVNVLCYKAVNHQICIRNQQIIDKYLQFIESYTLDK